MDEKDLDRDKEKEENGKSLVGGTERKKNVKKPRTKNKTSFIHNEIQPLIPVFSVNLVCKKELNLILKVSETSSQGVVGFERRGTDFFLPILYDLNNK